MLLDLSNLSPLTIDPGAYPRALAVRIDAPDERPECGVFLGRCQDVATSEEGQRVPVVASEEYGSKTFVLDRQDARAARHLIQRWAYAAIGWASGVFVEHPYVYTLTLEEHGGSDVEYCWSVCVTPATGLRGFRLVLHDFEAGVGMKLIGGV